MALTALAACAGQRPVVDIRESARWQQARGDYAAAAAEYEQIVHRYPGDWRAQYELGRCRLELGEPVRAQQSLEIARELRPGDERIIDALAESIHLQGDEDRLFKLLRAETQRTQSVQAYLRLARYSVAIGDIDSAKVAVDTAIEIDDGRSPQPYLDSAELAERLGDLELAIRRLRQAYGIDPDDQEIADRLVALGEIPGPTVALPPGR